jgi:hypothetical protein
MNVREERVRTVLNWCETAVFSRFSRLNEFGKRIEQFQLPLLNLKPEHVSPGMKEVGPQ